MQNTLSAHVLKYCYGYEFGNKFSKGTSYLMKVKVLNEK